MSEESKKGLLPPLGSRIDEDLTNEDDAFTLFALGVLEGFVLGMTEDLTGWTIRGCLEALSMAETKEKGW